MRPSTPIERVAMVDDFAAEVMRSAIQEVEDRHAQQKQSQRNLSGDNGRPAAGVRANADQNIGGGSEPQTRQGAAPEDTGSAESGRVEPDVDETAPEPHEKYIADVEHIRVRSTDFSCCSFAN